jgi:predicted transcriptional regulator
VTAGDQTVSVDGDVFEARGSMLYAEGDFAAAIKAGEGSGSPGIHMDLYGDPDFIRMSDTFWQAPAGAAPAAVGLAALLAVAALVFRETLVRLAAPLGLLYTKLKKPQLLDHERRQALHDVIKQEPGVTFLQLHQRLKDLFARGGGYGFGSLTYHLSQLERFGLIVSKREGRFRRYFENGGRFGRDTVRIALLQTPPIPDLVAALLEDPGASQTHLHASLRGKHDVTRQTVGYHLKRLTEKDLVEVVRNGRSNAYHPTDKLRELGEYAVAKTASLKDLDSTPAAAG